MNFVIKQAKIAIILLIWFLMVTGLLYPAFITLIAEIIFPWQANGSIIEKNGVKIGSVLIGQSFSDPRYFWSRPSATTPYPYNAANSQASNWGPMNPDFIAAVKERIKHLTVEGNMNYQPIPVDLVTSSASGVDPDISPYAAWYQIPRIAKARHFSEDELKLLVQNAVTKRTWGVLGEPRINVLKLNILLDELAAKKK